MANPIITEEQFNDPTSTINLGLGDVDPLLKLLRVQQEQTRRRYGQLGRGIGASQQDLSAALSPLQDQLSRTDALSGLMSGFKDNLVNSALGSTSGAGIAAANAARLSGGGQYGGGGMAAMTAARGAVDAAGGQSAALSQALVQGQLGEANFQSGLLQQRGGISAALSQLLQQQAGLKEERGKLGVSMDTELAAQLGGALGTYGGIKGSRNAREAQAKTDRYNAWKLL